MEGWALGGQNRNKDVHDLALCYPVVKRIDSIVWVCMFQTVLENFGYNFSWRDSKQNKISVLKKTANSFIKLYKFFIFKLIMLTVIIIIIIIIIIVIWSPWNSSMVLIFLFSCNRLWVSVLFTFVLFVISAVCMKDTIVFRIVFNDVHLLMTKWEVCAVGRSMDTLLDDWYG